MTDLAKTVGSRCDNQILTVSGIGCSGRVAGSSVLVSVLSFALSLSVIKWPGIPGSVIAWWRLIGSSLLWWAFLLIRRHRTDDYRDISNATSLLMRLELEGMNVGRRWDELASLSEARVDDGCLVFADLHYMLALAAAGRVDGGPLHDRRLGCPGRATYKDHLGAGR